MGGENMEKNKLDELVEKMGVVVTDNLDIPEEDVDEVIEYGEQGNTAE